MDVRLIAAVGRRGQLGLGGKLPWNDPLDLRWFRDTTMGGVILFGGRTYDAVGDLPGRVRARWAGRTEPYSVLCQVAARHKGKVIWIAGGTYTYKSFMPFVRIAVITRIDYDGEADTFMPPIWGSYDNGDRASHHHQSSNAASDRGPEPAPAPLLVSAVASVEASSDRSVVRKRTRRKYGWLSSKRDRNRT